MESLLDWTAFDSFDSVLSVGSTRMLSFDTRHVKVETEEVDEIDEPQCWICLSSDSSLHKLEKPCDCPRYVHKPCLSQWQIVSAGKREEEICRFCQQSLPDWRNSLADKPRAAPVMTVTHHGQNHILKVEPGEDGRRCFEEQIRRIYDLGEEDNISVTFGIKEPFSGNDMTLEGWGAWTAAVECAACSAGSRPPSNAGPEEKDSKMNSPLLHRILGA